LGEQSLSRSCGEHAKRGVAVTKSEDRPQIDTDHLRGLAQAGDAIAQRELGERLYSGKGCEADQEGGLEWLAKAANQGDAQAQYLMGVEDWGMERVKEAAEWWRKAADQKHPQALFWLGEIHSSADPPDNAAAALLYDEAAELGNSDAMNALGEIYLEGKGSVQKSAARAKGLFDRARDLGCVEALRNIARMYRDGLGVEANPKEAEKFEQEAQILEEQVLSRARSTTCE